LREAVGARTSISTLSNAASVDGAASEEDRRRADFEADTCKLLIALNTAWSGADQPFVRHYFEKHVRDRSKLPSSGTLSGRVLDEVAQGIIDGWQQETENQYGSSQSDGWKSISRNQILGNLIIVNGKVRCCEPADVLELMFHQVYVLNAHDITTRAKDSETYLNIVESEMAWVKTRLRCFIIAWCTDASGESVKMKKELRKKYPWLIILDCWSHQVTILHYLRGVSLPLDVPRSI
jgi:hypothetical protein